MAGRIPVLHLPSVDSTILEAHRQLAAGTSGPLWIVADVQTAGKGRFNRVWQSEPGNLYCTLVWPTAAPAAKLPQIGFVAACAVYDAVHKVLGETGRDVLLKWPNDCLIGGSKVSGILCEGQPHVAIIGCGINVRNAPKGLPYPATCLADHGARAPAADVFEVYASSLLARLAQWNDGAGFPDIARFWTSHAIGVGEFVEVTAPNETLHGVFEGIGAGGEALLRVKKELKPVWAGDFAISSLDDLRKHPS